ncbi:MAG: hypothetical protein AB1625_08560 [Acidobacteriota bacterium]
MRHRTLALAAFTPVAALVLVAAATRPAPPRARALTVDPTPPAAPVKLVFVHHSSGENWLADDHGGLGLALRDSNYFVSDTNYGWGPPDLDSGGGTIGDHTDIGHWYTWFAGPNRATYTGALLTEYDQHSSYARMESDPGGTNRVVMFKSCFPNSNLGGSPGDPPTTGANPLRGQDSGSEHMTVANAKGIYNDLLAAFASRQDVLWVVITAPPVGSPEYAANARGFNTWLARDWLAGYPYANVAVFDFYTVLTSNGGSWNVNDLGWDTGNHHRVRSGAVQHVTDQGGDTAAYPDGGSDDHPSPAGNRKATGEFVELLNVFHNRWRSGQVQPTPTPTATPPVTPTPTPTASATPTATPPASDRRVRRRLSCVRTTPTPALTGCQGPEPALVTDFAVLPAPAAAEPAARSPFRDPTFGRCLTRVTDRSADPDEDDTSGGLKNEYSRVQAFNADGSRLIVRGTEATWYVYDAVTLRPERRLQLDAEPRWDAVDPSALYHVSGTRILRTDVASGNTLTLHDFATDFPGQTLTLVWTRHEGSPSADTRTWGLVAEDETYRRVAFLVWDRVLDRIAAVRDTRGLPNVDGVDSVTISPSGSYFVAQFEPCEEATLGTDALPCGLMVYDSNLRNGRGLLRIVGHSDIALDASGREVMVYQGIDTDEIAMVDLGSGAVTPLWPIDFSHAPIGLHFSGQAHDRPGWAVVSTYSGSLPAATWMDDQVFLVELRAGGRVVRLAHTHSVVDPEQEHDYWAEPQATTNRDLTRVLFTSNWGRSGTDGVETFEIRLPADWPDRLQ